MLTLLTYLPQGSSAKCCRLLWRAVTVTSTQRFHTAAGNSHQAQSRAHYRHYLRSPYSLIQHYFKEVGNVVEARAFVKTIPRLNNVPPSQLEAVIKLIKSDGHCWKEVEMFKAALLIAPEEYTQRKLLLQSLSASHPSLYYIIWVISVMDRPLEFVRKHRKGVFERDPLEQLIFSGSYLRLPECVLHDAWELFHEDNTATLRQVVIYLLKHYMASRFSEDPEVVGSFLESMQKGYLLWKPLYRYPALCDVFIQCLQLSFSEVQEKPHLLQLNPENTRIIAKKFPQIGGSPVREVAKVVPKLFELPVSQLNSWLTLLDKHKVDKFYCNHHTVDLFKTNSFSEVEERLRIITQLQEWEIVKVSNLLFEILKSHEGIKKLLNITQSGQVIPSLRSLINPSDSTTHKRFRRPTPEIVSYIANKLGMPIEEIREVLADELFTPHGITNTTAVLKLLLDYGFTREQVVAGAVVLNLEAGIVEQSLKDLHTRSEAQPFAEWMENPFVLHLLVYCISKDIVHIDLPIKK